MRPIGRSRNVVRMLAATLMPEHCSSGHCGKLCRWSHLISSAKGQRDCWPILKAVSCCPICQVSVAPLAPSTAHPTDRIRPRYPGHAVQIEPGLWPQSSKNGSFSHFRRRLSSNSLRDCPKSDPGDRWLIRKSPPLAGLSASIRDILSGSRTAWLATQC
jgi:hypothetical protein